jgi:hypothetical protein
LGTFKPGEYTLNIKITDHLSEQTISPSARFRIRKQ